MFLIIEHKLSAHNCENLLQPLTQASKRQKQYRNRLSAFQQP